MTPEEKAKAYEEALDKAKKLHKTCDNRAVVGWCEYIFPELQKSKDERMWELIKKYAHYNISDMALDTDHITREQLESWIEKQSEQKPAEWHSEDEQNLNACLGYLPDEFLARWLKDAIHVRYDKPIENQKPVKWSEEDEYLFHETIKHLEELINIDKANHCGVDVQYYQRDIDWLKSIKDRIQSNQSNAQSNGIWHSADEEPDKDKEVLVEWKWSDCNPIYHEYHAKFNRRYYDRNKLILHWAYIVDLIKATI